MARIDWTITAVAAPGLRPTASDAFAPMAPTARDAPTAARPTCRFPSMYLLAPFLLLTASTVGAVAYLQNQSCAVACPSYGCWQINSVKTAVNNMNTSA